MDACSNAKSAFRLTRVLDQWFQRAAEVGAYLEYEIAGVVKDNNGGEERIAELLDVILPPVAENCLRLAPADRWISLHVSIQPQVLLLECSSAGKYYLESGKTPEGVSSVELTQCEDSFQLRMKLEC